MKQDSKAAPTVTALNHSQVLRYANAEKEVPDKFSICTKSAHVLFPQALE